MIKHEIKSSFCKAEYHKASSGLSSALLQSSNPSYKFPSSINWSGFLFSLPCSVSLHNGLCNSFYVTWLRWGVNILWKVPTGVPWQSTVSVFSHPWLLDTFHMPRPVHPSISSPDKTDPLMCALLFLFFTLPSLPFFWTSQSLFSKRCISTVFDPILYHSQTGPLEGTCLFCCLKK